MPTEADPIVNNWYQHLDKGQRFKVVAMDEDNGIVETQHFDGDMEELDLDTWYELDIEPIETPEDWTGPMDDIERDDLGYTETDMQSQDWFTPLPEHRRGQELWHAAEADEEDIVDEEPPEEEPWEEGEDS